MQFFALLASPIIGAAFLALFGARRWAPDVLNGVRKDAKHTALSDIHDSIAELRHYRAAMGKLGGLD